MAYKSLALDADQTLDDAKRQRLYQLLPAQRFVEGNLRCPVAGSVNSCALALEVRDATAQPLAAFEEQFSRGDYVSAVARGGEKVRQALGVSIAPAQAASLASRRSVGPAVLQLLGEGVAAYGKLDLSNARELLQSATSIDPTSFDVQRALSVVLQRQGLITRAREAAERAAVAPDLSPARRAETLSQVEWLGASKQRALAAYQKRFDAGDDDVDLAIALARRLPPAAGLALLKRAREQSPPGRTELTLDLQEAALEREERNLDRARQLLDRAVQAAQRLKARRELSAANELDGRLPVAEQLATEAGDKQRAAYLHLALVRNIGGAVREKYLAESLRAFRELGDHIGIYWSLFQRAYGEDDMQAARQILDEAHRELRAAGEPLSVVDHSLAAEIWLGLGDLKKARQSLELAREAPDSPLDLLFDLPSAPDPVDPTEAEMELLWQEDRLDEAENAAKERLRQARASTASLDQTFLCWLQCERGSLSESARCYDRLALKGGLSDAWGKRVAECFWRAGDLERTDRIADASKNLEVLAATSLIRSRWADFSSRWGDFTDPIEELTKMIEIQRAQHNVPGRLRAELMRGTAELRNSRRGGRRHIEAVLAEARRRELPLLVRHASSALAAEPVGKASVKPKR
jgi:hypothetical protein